MANGPSLTLPPTADDGFYREVLRGIGAPITANTLALVYAWRQAEGGRATYNPFNTTQRMTGSTAYNSVGVQSYARPSDGVAATVKTMRNGKYEPVLALLRANAAPTDVAKAVIASPWGTKGLLLDVLAMYARGKVVVAPISVPPGGMAASTAEATVTNAPKGTRRSSRRGSRASIPAWVWWTAGGTAAVGLALWLATASRRRGSRAG